jgi:hypothetical protein
MIDSTLSCKDETRREAVRAAPHFGLDYIEVSANQTTLNVFFLGKAPGAIEKANVTISGGIRITGIRVTGITMHRQKDPALDDSMEVRVNHPGDFSTYTLSVATVDALGQPTSQPMQGFDALFSSVDFTFKGGCATGLDCLPQKACPPLQFSQPEINYLAKDYDSFRQLILDRLALIMPSWQETHQPDIGVALVELLAYVGDYLSYYQDAVATEAYLGTARQRISVRRHVRLIDYAMHEGCNARAWITLATDSDQQFDPAQIYFVTAFPGAPAAQILTSKDLANVPASTYEVFQPLLPAAGTVSIFEAHSAINFYTWGDKLCCLAPGTTSATLVDKWIPAPAAKAGTATTLASDGPPGTVRALQLKAGDFLLFEEVFGAKTGDAADADPTHCQVVRLTSATPAVDALYIQPVIEIEWTVEDALTFPLCLSIKLPSPACTMLPNLSVARGNVLLVDHGASTIQDLGAVPTGTTTANCPTPCHPALVEVTPGLFRPTLTRAPLTFSQPMPSGSCVPASMLTSQDPHQALPAISLTAGPSSWHPVSDLLESAPGDYSFVVEMDNDGNGHLRFGDGRLGRQPAAGAIFQAGYRVGNGPSGNVGADKIKYLVLRAETLSGVTIQPRNPLPARGGSAHEPISEVKLFAPHAFQDVPERAITAADYATLAADNSRRQEERPSRALCAAPFVPLQGAKATLRWTGGWYEALVAVDPMNSEKAPPELVGEIRTYLEPYRRMGHDLTVARANYVPLDLALSVCVLPGYLRAHVEQALLQVFSSSNFFNPNNLTFGEGIYVSRIVAATQAVTGVASVSVRRLQRYQINANPYPPAFGIASGALPWQGVLTLGPFEIAQLDNDPNFPENGLLELNLRGGR